jgi:DNA modification methylase
MSPRPEKIENPKRKAYRIIRGKNPEVHCAHSEMVALDKIISNPRNPNVHPHAQIELLATIIKEQGWRAPITVSKRSGHVVRGHGRLEAARHLGAREAPVDYQEYSSEESELADLIADNQIAELSHIDGQNLCGLIEDLAKTDLDIELTGFDSDGLDNILASFSSVNLEDDSEESVVDPIPTSDEMIEILRVKWGVEFGQLWQLGDHRILCGDSTSADDVARLLGDDKPHLMVTDPPYGVEYDADWRNKATRADGTPIGASATGAVQNDDRADWSEAWALFPGDVVYVWHGSLRTAEVLKSLESVGLVPRSMLIWNKSNFAIGRGDYHPKHEPCWYAVRKGKPGHYNGDRTQSTVWDIAKPQKSETGHSTQKPIECMARPIRNNSKRGDYIYEPFSGSGTTIIACEELGRKCLAMEIYPGYVAIALERYYKATGKDPKLVEK